MCVEVEDVAYGLKVRLTYATLINYTSRVLGLIASLFFVVSVTRRLSVEEFGVWTMIFRYISYVLPFASIYSYWLPRTISRGLNTSKTGVFLSIILGSIATVAYIGISYEVSSLFQQPLIPLLLASVVVMLDYVNSCLNAVSIAHSPQNLGYASLTLRIVQAVLGLMLVVFYRLGLYGAILSVIGGKASSLLLLLVLNWKLVKNSKLDFRVGKEWISRAWLPLYSYVSISLIALDVLIVRVVGGGEEAIAYYGVSTSLIGLALISTQALPALYTRLLAGRSVNDVLEASWISFMLTVPIVVGVIVYAEPILAIYNIKYVVAAFAARIFAVASAFQLLTSIIATTLRGLEQRDLNSLKSLELKSTILFKVPTYRLLSILAYLTLVFLVSNVFKLSPPLIAAGWGVAYIVREVISQRLYFNLLRREFRVTLPLKDIFKYIGRFVFASTSIVLIGIVYPVEPHPRIYTLISRFSLALIVSIIAYFSLLWVIDERMRVLVHKVRYRLFK